MEEILKKIEEQQMKIDAIYISVEKLRKYFLWTLAITIATIVLPVIAMVFMIPYAISTLSGAYGGLL